MPRKRPKRPIITKNYALQGFQLVIPEMFSNFVKVSFYKHSTNISNDMTKKLILAAAMLLTGSAAVAAQPKVISHRGYWTAPNSAQNSLASFTKADSVGVFGSEIDVWHLISVDVNSSSAETLICPLLSMAYSLP